MVDFRRGIAALGMLALFTGLASAQVTGGTGQQTLSCATNVTVPPQLRGEGYTEQTGDIVIRCTGGPQMTPGSVVPLVNFAVSYNTNVTSRLLPTTSGVSGGQASSQTSEALLLIDEPGSGLPGDGPAQPQRLCTTPLVGCPAVVGGTLIGNVALDSNGNRAPNVYQGIVTGNTVTFLGVPALPPATTGERVYRITNVRVNAVPLAGGSASGATAVQAGIQISGATSLPITQSTQIVGYVSTGLTTGASSQSYNQCETKTRQPISVVTFTEGFATAFKTRVFAQNNTQYAGQLGQLPTSPNPGNQATPGTIYNSESNFVFPIGSYTAGLADYGTRLKATFNNIPAGARVFVSVANVNNNLSGVTAPASIGGSTANSNSSSTLTSAYVGYALLVSNESISDGATGPGSGFLPTLPVSDNAPGTTGTVGVAEVTNLFNGSGSAVWEVVNTNPNTVETFRFAVYVSYTANTAQNSPLPGTSTVNLSFAPGGTSSASSSAPVPRFAGDSVAARNIWTVNICRTVLLYPFITNQAGYDTGLTIANTTSDPFGMPNQAGSCKLSYYGGTTSAPTTPPAAIDTPSIPAGTVWANTVRNMTPNFQGYMFAVCNFQYAHGFAFISDVGGTNLAMGYLAVVLNDPRTNTNTTGAENGAH